MSRRSRSAPRTAPVPPRPLPPGRTVLVPGRGEFFVRDSGGDGTPVLLVHGTRDRLVPVGAARRTAALNPAWQTALLEGVGHTPQLEAPEEVLGHLEVWLDALD